MRVSINLIAGAAALTATAAILFLVFRQGKTLAEAGAAVVDAVNPLNPDNVIASTVNSAVSKATDGGALSVGDFLYQKLNADDAGKIAVADSPARNAAARVLSLPSNVVNISDYFKTVDQDDADMVLHDFNSTVFVSNGGGAATGRTVMRK
jgi:hypothetical protein